MIVMDWYFVKKTQQRKAFQSICVSYKYYISVCVSFFYTFSAVDHVLCLYPLMMMLVAWNV
jgi:hypothetical protein